MDERKLRMGVAGLGRAFTLMLPTLAADPRVELVAAADPRGEATQRFAADFGGRVYASVAQLCRDADVEAVYVATPHQLHAEHVLFALAQHKHVLVEKPMALTLAECEQMIAAADRAGVRLVVGHSHSFDRPILRTREIIESGDLGRVRLISAQYFTDFMYRPRRPEELVSENGGGVVFSQAAHQVDIVRLLAGGMVSRVRAVTGAWDGSRPSEGAYAALLTFADGAFASLVYSGYAHFDGDEICGGLSELGNPKNPGHYGTARRNLRRASNAAEETALKHARNYGGRDYVPQSALAAGKLSDAHPRWHEHFGSMLVSCDRADLRPLPTGVMIYGDDVVTLDALAPPQIPRIEVIDELYDSIVRGKSPLHDGRWAMATLEVCLAMLRSAREERDIGLEHQVAVTR